MDEDEVADGESDTLPLKDTSITADDDAGNKQIGKPKGLGFGRALFLTAGCAFGAGLVNLPSGFKRAGWTALLLLVAAVVSIGYCNHMICQCWIIVRERYQEARDGTRRPYPLIAEKAYGTKMAMLTNAMINIGCLGSCVVAVLLSAENLEHLSQGAGIPLSRCYWLLILFGIQTPLTWFDTPKDFWLYGVIGLLSTTTAFLTTLIVLLHETAKGKRGPPQTNPSAIQLFFSMGSLAYSLGVPQLLNVQHDMRHPEKSPWLVVCSFGGPLIAYAIICTLGYVVYGRELDDNILQNLPHHWPRVVGEVAILVHFIFSYLLVINTANQLAEASFGIGSELTWKKCLLRSSLSVLVLFVAETIPNFGVIMSVVGAIPGSFLMAIGPALFYPRLCSQKGLWPDRSLPLHIRVFCIEVICVVTFIGCVSTYASIHELVNTHSDAFVPPCWLGND